MDLPAKPPRTAEGTAPATAGRPWLESAWIAAAAYLVFTLLLTWPLLPGILHDIPADLGDSLLNCWILHWDMTRLLAAAKGDLGQLSGFWNASIFYPAPLALAYSEHLVPQAVQVLPVYALTGNLVLCYNLLFISTFVLSGLGVYLLVRSLTGNATAAFAAGLLFAFVPYRIAQFPHVQVLSTQWMPFTLFGLHRYVRTRRAGVLAGASAALLAQNLSCGYFLAFFAPFAAAFAAWELVRTGRARDGRMLLPLVGAGALVALATWPFVQPYIELSALRFNVRNLDEVGYFSANGLAYLTSTPSIRGFGRAVMVFPAPEGELFPGLVLIATVVAGMWTDRRSTRVSSWRSAISIGLGLFAAAQAALLVYWLAGGDTRLEIGPFLVRSRGLLRPALMAAGALAAFVAASPRARAAMIRLFIDGRGFWTLSAAAAAVLSLGPVLRVGLEELGPGPYALLFQYVPGFDGLRVPARMGMVAALMLAVLAGLALDRLLRERARPRLLVAALVLLFLSEAWTAPIVVNGRGGAAGLRAPAPIAQGERVPAVYRYLRSLPTREPVIEFPFAEPVYELQYVYYATEHGHPIVNGYSGVFPPRYLQQRAAFGHGRRWKRPWEVLLASGAHLLVLHEGAYLRPNEGERLRAWLVAQGARPVATFGTDTLFRLPVQGEGGRS